MRGKTRSGIFTIWVKTLANLFLHLWLETAEVKQIFTFHFSLYHSQTNRPTLKSKTTVSLQSNHRPCNRCSIELSKNPVEAQSNSLFSSGEFCLSLSQIQLWLGFCNSIFVFVHI